MALKFDIFDTSKVAEVIQVYNQVQPTYKPIFDEMNKNYNMIVSSAQWDADIKTELEENGRTAFAYNLLSNVIKHMSSLEAGNRKKITALGRTLGDVKMAATISKLLDCLLYNQKFDYHRTRAFIDAIIARIGWLRTCWSFEDDSLGMLDLQSINPMQIMFEMGYSDITLRKSSFVLFTPDLSLDQIINQYGQKDKKLLQEILRQGDNYFAAQTPEEKKKFLSTTLRTLLNTAQQFFNVGTADQSSDILRNEMWYDPFTGKFKTLELHERRTTRRMMLYDPAENKNIDITDNVLSEDKHTEDNELIQQQMTKHPEASEPSWKPKKQIWITTVIPALNIKVADEPYAIRSKNFMFTPVFCYDFHADMRQTQSVIDELRDPQSDYNKTRSTLLEMLVRFSSVGYLVEEGAIDGFENDYTNKEIGTYKRVKTGFLEKVKPEEYPRIPPELFRNAEESKYLLEYISGTPKAVRGLSEGSNEPAKLFNAKNDVAVQLIQHIYDNLDQAILQVGENIIPNIQKFMTMPRVFRIINDFDKPEYLEVNKPEVIIEQGKVVERILNDVTIGEYDIVISNAPYGPTEREMEFVKLVDLMKFAITINPQFATKMFPVMVKASDSSYRTEVLEALDMMDDQKGDKEAQAQTAMLALQQAFQKLELDKGSAELQNQMIQNQQDQVETEGKVLDNTQKKINLQLEAHGKMLDNEKKNYDFQVAQKSQQDALNGMIVHSRAANG